MHKILCQSYRYGILIYLNNTVSRPMHGYHTYMYMFIKVSFFNLQKDTPGRKDTSFRFLMAKNIQRPQLRFKDKIDNSNTPFIPIIKRKPNALRPLEISKYHTHTH